MIKRDISRRKFLVAAGATGAVAAPVVRSLTKTVAGDGVARWSDASTWGGKAPAADEVAVISRTVLVDRDAEVAGVVVRPNGKLVFDADRNVTLSASGNVIVNGVLKMRPRSSKFRHRLVFTGVNEQAFQGGGLDPLASDVGLWVMGDGRLDVRGGGKKDWTRVAGNVAAGTHSITLKQRPIGWRRGDLIAITPTGSASKQSHYADFDVVRVKAINGKRITLSAATKHSHPEIEAQNKTFTAEVLNLTRNVVIRGTPGKRAHIFIRSTRPQSIKNCMIRHMGPRKNGEKVLGRWPLHFHHAMNGSRGSVVQGVVIREAGSHAFVPHVSHGITFRDCIAFNVLETAFWWDEEIVDATDDILWDHCVAALVKITDSGDKFRLAGFVLRSGNGNLIRDCVAVGVQGLDSSAGYHWPSPTTGIWKFENCLAHNNNRMGAFAWKNGEEPHGIDGFTAYRNGISAVMHGAYANAFHYENMELLENGFELHARSKVGTDGVPLTLAQTRVKNADVGLLVTGSVQPGKAPAKINQWSFVGCNTPIEFRHKGAQPGQYEFNNCTVGGNKLQKSDIKFTSINSGSTVMIDGVQVYP
jgi:G8 domain